MVSVYDFTSLSIDKHKDIISYRNHNDVRVQMNTSNYIDLESHFKFVEKLKNDTNNKYWLVKDVPSNEDIGVIYLNGLTETKVFLGLYVNLNSEIKGKGTLLMNEIERIAFRELHLTKLFLEVKSDNKIAIALYEKFNYKRSSTTSNNGLLEMYKENFYE